MSDDTHGPSTMTCLFGDSPDDALLHRALSLPQRQANRIVLGDGEGRTQRSKYVFDGQTPIGEGGTAVVFRVRDTQLNVTRALKVLLVDLGSAPEAHQRWQRECELLLALESADAPSVPTIYEVGTIDGLPAIVMQFIEGVTLSKWLQQAIGQAQDDATGAYSIMQVLAIAEPLAQSLAHVESRFRGTEREGFAHGDIKPSNIIVSRQRTADEGELSVGQVWLLDFGEASVRQSNVGGGITPAYASPEQVTTWLEQQAPTISAAGDQYQLGVVLQELIAPLEAWQGSRRLSPSSVAERWQLAHLRRVSGRMTARRATDRYPNFTGMLADLRRTRSLPRKRVRRFVAVAVLIVALVLMALVTSWTARPLDPEATATLVQGEWEQWQEPPLWSASRSRLEARLATQYSQWQMVHGSATANAARQEMRRRMDLLGHGEYILRLVKVQPDEWYAKSSPRDPEHRFDRVTLMLVVDDQVAGQVTGKVQAGAPVTFEDDTIAFTWQPGKPIALEIDTESPWDRAQAAREARERAEPQRRTEEPGNEKRVFVPSPSPPPDISSLRPTPPWGNNGMMALALHTRCTGVDGDALVGHRSRESLDWHIKIVPR